MGTGNLRVQRRGDRLQSFSRKTSSSVRSAKGKSRGKVGGFQRRAADFANTPTQATNIAAAIKVASAEGTCMAIIA